MNLGRIDCIGFDLIIEAKKIDNHGIKSAIGQLLLYDSVQAHRRKLALALIGDWSKTPIWVQTYCKSQGIAIFWFNGCQWVLLHWNDL